MSYFFDAGVVGAWHLSNSYVISVALWVVSLCFAVVCAVTWELLGDTPDSLVPSTPMSFALSILNSLIFFACRVYDSQLTTKVVRKMMSLCHVVPPRRGHMLSDTAEGTIGGDSGGVAPNRGSPAKSPWGLSQGVANPKANCD